MRCPQGGKAVEGGLPADLVKEDAGEGCAKDPDEHGGSHAQDLQDGDEQKAEEGEGGLRGAQVA